MSKPSIAELLNASGHVTYTEPLVMRAMYTLYGNIGANLDERNWSAITQSSNPLETAEAGLLGMYQDSGYLLRNTQHLGQSGYVAAQAEITYRQMADRLGFTYQPDWSEGTSYESLGPLSMGQLIALVPVAPPPPPSPTISIASSATDFTVSLNVAGTVKMSVSGDLGSFAAGATVLTEQAAIKEGFVTLSSNGNTSTGTSQYVVLGTVGDDSINTSGAGNLVDYIFGGTGNDTIHAGNGNDVVFGGAGNDVITGGLGADSVALGAADAKADQVIYTAPGETASGLFTSGGSSAGMDMISEASHGDVIDLWDVFSATPTIGTAFLSAATANNAAIVQGTLNTGTGVFTAGADNDYMVQWADGTAVHSIVLKDFGVTAPTLIVNVGNDTLTLAPVYNMINGTAGVDTLNGGAGYDMIIGGAGIDTMNGGDGDDVFIIASGADHGNTNNGEKIYGGNGVDVIRFASTTPNDTLNLSYWIDVEEVRIVAADGSENSTAGLGINADWLGVGPNIKLYGNAGSNNLVGNGDGSNTIEGGAGNDTIVGGFRADVLFGDAGDDTITGGAGADVIDGGADADSIQFATTLEFGSAGDASANGGPAWAVGVDAITFVVADDTFRLDETVFGLMGDGASIGAAGGILAAAQFEAVAGAAANLAGTLDTAGNGAVVYDTTNDDLYFLGAGAANNTNLAALVAAGTALKIADVNLTGVITAADFFIIQ